MTSIDNQHHPKTRQPVTQNILAEGQTVRHAQLHRVCLMSATSLVRGRNLHAGSRSAAPTSQILQFRLQRFRVFIRRMSTRQ